MTRFFSSFDQIFAIDSESAVVRGLERVMFFFMTVMVLFAPHSIAVTQSAWIIGLVAWFAVSFFRPRKTWRPSALDIALWAFFLWSVVSSVCSYAPDISLDKLRGVSLFMIFMFVAKNLRTVRSARFLGLALVASALFVALMTPVERIIGRGVQIYDFKGSAFDAIGLEEGDVLLKIDGKKVSSLEEVRQRINENPNEKLFKAQISRADSLAMVDVSRELVKPAPTAEESLGVRRWNKSRNWRAAGFYGHFTTFAEVMQLIAALAVGLFVALLSAAMKRRESGKSAPTDGRKGDLASVDEAGFVHPSRLPGFSSSRSLLLAGLTVAFIALALLLTVTRASQLAFLISSAVIVFAVGNKRLMIALAAVALPAALVGLFVLQDMRRVSFFDSKDNSTTWRQTVYREGFDLWTKSPRNFTVGVGMDSIKRYAAEWHLFDDGRLPAGHFHSTLLQLGVERGFPAIIIWLVVLGVYATRLRRGIADLKGEIATAAGDVGLRTVDLGILLGALGGLVGFFTSGLVHYNLGDGEVAMVFYMIMGIAVVISNSGRRLSETGAE